MLHTFEDVVMIFEADVETNMDTDAISEVDLITGASMNMVTAVKPRKRVAMKMSDAADVMKRHIAGAKRDH